MYVCMYVCMYVSMCVCMCVCMYVCMYVCVYVCMYVYVCKYVCYLGMCVSVCRLYVQFAQSTQKQVLVPLLDTKTQLIQHVTSCLLKPVNAVSVILSLFRSWISVNSKIMVSAVG